MIKKLFVARYAGGDSKRAESFFSLGLKTAEFFSEFKLKFTKDGAEYFDGGKKLRVVIAYDRNREDFTELHEVGVEGDEKSIGNLEKALAEIYSSNGFRILK